jgi:hypothetical protein
MTDSAGAGEDRVIIAPDLDQEITASSQPLHRS